MIQRHQFAVVSMSDCENSDVAHMILSAEVTIEEINNKKKVCKSFITFWVVLLEVKLDN